MKFQLSSLLVIAFIGIVLADGFGMQPPAPVVYPALLGLGWSNPLPNNNFNNMANNMINNIQCRLSFAETALQIRHVFNALVDDAANSQNRFLNSGFNQQLQQNLNKYFENLRIFNGLANRYLTGQMYLSQFIKENFMQLARLVKDLIAGKVYLIRAGIRGNHLLPKTYDAAKHLLNTLYNDLSCLIMNPSKAVSYFNEMMNLLFGRNMLGMGLGMGPLTPLSNMLNMGLSIH